MNNKVIINPFVGVIPQKIHELLNKSSQELKVELTDLLFSPQQGDSIKAIPLSDAREEDRWYWKGTTKGVYTVGYGYDVAWQKLFGENGVECAVRKRNGSTDDVVVNWMDLPDDVTARILEKLGPIQVLLIAQNVCRSWWKICKEDNSMWRHIYLTDSVCKEELKIARQIDNANPILSDKSMWGDSYFLWTMCRNAVDRSHGQLTDVNIEFFGLPGLLPYIAKRSTGRLKRLRLVTWIKVTNDELIKAAPKFPLLEELQLTNKPFFKEALMAIGKYCPFPYSKEALIAVGKSCPLLNSLKLNKLEPPCNRACDDQAMAIAESMPGLCHLQLLRNNLTDNGLYAILNGCPHLEYLDLRQSRHLSLSDDLRHRLRSFNGYVAL
ncbi:hypothetical protein ACFE04_026169 [Oxalis oulophora]